MNQQIECYLNNTTNLRPLLHTLYHVIPKKTASEMTYTVSSGALNFTPTNLYPQDGDRIVAIDSVTSLHPIYTHMTKSLTADIQHSSGVPVIRFVR